MPDKTFDVLIQLNSRAEGIAAWQAQIASTRAEVGAMNAGLLDTGRSFNQIATSQKALVAEMLAGNQAQTAQQEQRLAIEGEINAMIGLRRDLVAAQIQGDEAAVALARDELAIRGSTLATLRSEALSQQALNDLIGEENALLTLAAKKNEEVAAGGLLIGASLNKAKGEAVVLGRELATGSVNARTIGALLGSFGTYFSIAAIGAFGLWQLIRSIREDEEKFNKDIKDQTQRLSDHVREWRQLALAAGDYKDVLGIIKNIQPELDAVGKKLGDLQKKDEEFRKGLEQFGVDINAGDPYSAGTTALTAKIAVQAGVVRQYLEEATKMLDVAQRSQEAWDAIKTEPLSEGITDVSSRIDELKRKIQELQAAAAIGLMPGATPEALRQSAEAVRQLLEAMQLLTVWQQRRNELENRFGQTTRETAALLRQIRGEQQLIAANPYLSAEAARDLLHNAALKEEAALLAQIGKIEADIKSLEAIGGPEAQERIERLKANLDELILRLKLVRLTAQETTAGGEFTADLSKWVSSFGTASHQIANTIEGTINTALQGTNQLLLDSVFRTGNWRQTLVGVERQILNLFLTMAEQMILQNTLGRTLQAQSTAQQVASGGAIAAAHAPAAAATSISSYGTAAVVGEVLALAAIAAIIAALSGGFRKGDYTGEGHPDDIAGFVHKKEFVFTAEETEKLGVPFLRNLARAAGGRAILPGYYGGGYVDPSAPGYTGYDRYGNLMPGATASYISPSQFGANPGGYGISFDPRSNTFFYYDPTANGGSGATFWAPVDYSQSGYSEASTPTDPYSWMGDLAQSSGPRYAGDPSTVGGGGVDVTPGWSEPGASGPGAAGTDYWAASATWGTYGIDWAYDANGTPQPMSYFAATGQTPSSGSGVGGVGGGYGTSTVGGGSGTTSGLGIPLYSFGSGIGFTTIFTGGARIGAYSFPGMSAATAAAVSGHISSGEIASLLESGSVGSGDSVHSGNIAVSESARSPGDLLHDVGGSGAKAYAAALARAARWAAFGWKDPFGSSTGFQQKANPFNAAFTPNMPWLGAYYGAPGSPNATFTPLIASPLDNIQIPSPSLDTIAAKAGADFGSPGSGNSGGFMTPGSKSGAPPQRMPPIYIHIYHDINNAIRAHNESPEGRSHLVTTVKRNG